MLNWRLFWILWLSGLALLLGLFAAGGQLVTSVAPDGVLDHQSAATAARVDAIYASWAEADVIGVATAGFVVDLLFIGVYSLGGAIGALLLVREGHQNGLRYLAKIAVGLYILFFLADVTETTSQLIQHLSGHGSDTLAALAAAVQPAKAVFFLLASAATLTGLLWRKLIPVRPHAA